MASPASHARPLAPRLGAPPRLRARTPRPPAATPRDAVAVTFVRPAHEDALEDDVAETTHVAEIGANLLAVAVRCGAVDAADEARFCLEGRCDACVMEDVATGEPIRACQTTISAASPTRLWLGGMDGDDPWGCGGGVGDDAWWDEDDADDAEGSPGDVDEESPGLERARSDGR